MMVISHFVRGDRELCSKQKLALRCKCSSLIFEICNSDWNQISVQQYKLETINIQNKWKMIKLSDSQWQADSCSHSGNSESLKGSSTANACMALGQTIMLAANHIMISQSGHPSNKCAAAVASPHNHGRLWQVPC